MKRLFLIIAALVLGAQLLIAQDKVQASQKDSIVFEEGGIYSLEDFRAMALQSNKDLQIASQNLKAAEESRKQMFTQFLPSIDFNAAYMRTGKSVKLLGEDKYLPVVPTPPFDPTAVMGFAYLPQDALTCDIQNMFGGSISLVQPVYMGGLVRQMYKLSKINEEVQRLESEQIMQNVILEVDESYWRCVSLMNKKKLAEQYLALLDKLLSNVEKMKAQGMATKGDVLNVKVKQNEASLALTKIDNGLELSKMALNQLCGLKISGSYRLKDENIEQESVEHAGFDMEKVFAMRPEIRMLEQANEAAKANTKLALSRFMPNLILNASFIGSNPNTYNGFSKTFKTNYIAGAVLNIPITHFGERVHNYRASKFKQKVAEINLAKAKEKVELQLNQSSFRIMEANRKLGTSITNMSSADENLRLAKESYAEGLISLTDLLAAHTAWLGASSEKIDAGIDVRLCTLYLEKAKGELSVESK